MSHDHDHDGDHHHGTHDHAHDRHEDQHGNAMSDLDKLKLLLPYLIDHNREHAEELKEWRDKAKGNGMGEVSDDLTEVIHLSDRIVEHLRKALNKLGAVKA